MASLLLLALGCTSKEVTWTQYNADTDALNVQVGTTDLLPAVSTALHSNTGEVEIGTASVDPGGGPVGTRHVVRVEVGADYKDDVDRVSVRTTSGDRGEDEYDLTADSAGEGLYVYTLESVGEDGETRDDTFTFRLWSASDTGG
jgi:hypothetical protein